MTKTTKTTAKVAMSLNLLAAAAWFATGNLFLGMVHTGAAMGFFAASR